MLNLSRRSTLLDAVALVAIVAGPGLAQDRTEKPISRSQPAQTEKPSPDITAIRAQSQAFVTAFNQGDAESIAALWTPNGEYVDDAGIHYVGRNAIEKAYAEFFTAHAGVKIQLAIDSLRVLSDNAAVEDGRAIVDPAPPRGHGVSKYTVMHVKVDGKWLMASVRDSWIATPADADSAADLNWLVGSWVAEEHGVRNDSVCRWAVEGHFLERTYTTTHANGSKTSGVQLIGWNPQLDQVQSWDFSPDGGHAIGRWSPTAAGWRAEVQGTTGTGIPTAAVNVLQRLDDSAYVWQSVGRTLGDVALPDTGEIIIKRAPKPKSK